MAKYRKKPVVIEAFQIGIDPMPDWFMGKVSIDEIILFGGHPSANELESVLIQTLEGQMTGNKGDWAIQGVKGEIYPCKPDIFAATYEPVTNQHDHRDE